MSSLQGRLWLLAVAATAGYVACTTDTAVGPADVIAVEVFPDSVPLVLGERLRLQSIVTDSRGIRYIGLPTEWSSGSPTVATVSGSGEVIGVAQGTSVITAVIRGLSATAHISVTPRPVIVTTVDTVTLSAFAHGPTPAGQKVVVSNGGGGVLDNLTDTVVYLPGASDWLTVTHGASSAPDTIALTVRTTAFAIGTYTAHLQLRSPLASNTPKTVVARLVLGTANAAQISADSGDGQSAPVNTTVATRPTVIVHDQFGNPVPGVSVTFAVASGGGSVTGATNITDVTGRARAGSWKLGTTAGTNSLTATAAPLPGSPVTFTATATPGPPSQLVKQPGGDGQTAAVATTVPVPPAVQVQDQFANPVPGVSVSFVPTPGSGSVTGGTATSEPAGLATVGSWTLGTAARVDTLVATAGTATARFTATATAGPATQIAAQAGQNQSAVVNTAVPTAPAVLVTDQFANPVAGVVVTFTVISGGGTATKPVDTTDASGTAAVGAWTLGTTAAPNTLNAVAPSLSGSPVAFTATGTPGAPAGIAKTAGDNQSATVGTAVSPPPQVLVTDQFGNAVPGASVHFAIASGAGQVNGGPTADVATDGTGHASGTWTVGTIAGTNTLNASVAGLPAVTFTATALAGSGATLTRVSAASRTDTIGASFADSVKVSDASNNPVSGVTITWAAGGPGSFSPVTSSTNANGIATSTRTLGTSTSSAVDTAKAAGLTGSPVLFTATTTSGRATTLSIASGNNQTDTVGQTLATPYSVLARDRAGNAVAGVSVSFAITAGGGQLDGGGPVTKATGANGQTSVTRTLGSTAGTQTVSATSGTLAGSPLTFTATAVHDAPAQIAVSAGNNQSATVGTAVPIPPTVITTDQFGNPVAGIVVDFAIASGGGILTKPKDTTDAVGLAAVGSWTLGPTTGSNTLTAASSPALAGSPVLFTATGNSGLATTMALAGGNNQTDTVRATLATQYAVLITDPGSNPVQGVTVSWAVTKGGGTITSTSQTDASGIARATRVLGDTAGTQTATASVGGLSGSPVTVTATANPGRPAQLAKQAGDGQSATVNTTVATAPAASVKDAYGNAVSAVNVTFTVTGGGGQINGAAGPVTVATNAAGVAALTSWRLGTVAGTNTLSATSTGLTTVTFTATGTPGAAATIAKTAGDNQSATVGTAVSPAPQVLVTDQFGNTVPGATVHFAIASGAGQVNGGATTDVATDGTGHASAAWTVGTVAGANTLNASVGAVTPVTFTVTGTAAAAQTIALQSGNGQTDTIEATLAVPYAVRVSDQYSNAVSGVNVTFIITAGGGQIDGVAGPVTKATGVNGQASVTRKLGTLAGTQTVQATASVPAGSPVAISATATSGNPTTLAANSATALADTVTQVVSPSPSVKATDRAGNPVQGVAITFSPSSVASGSVTGGTQTTAATGVATVGGWTLDQTVGNDTVLATSSPVLTGSPVRFVATSSPGAPSLTVSTISANPASPNSITACSATCTTGGGTASLITVTVKDQFGNVISGKTVTPSCSVGTSCTFNPTSGATNTSGVFTSTFNSTKAEAKTIQASVTGSGTLSSTAAVMVDPDFSTLLSSSVVTATSPITASSGGSVSTVTVTVRDQFLNPVSGRTVTIAVSPVTGNTVTQPAATTNASGQTTGSFFTTKAETKTVTASVSGTGGGTITDNALVTVNPGTPSSIAVNAGNNQTARVGTAVATTPSAIVRDAFSNPVPNVTVTFSVGSGGGSLTAPTTPLTNASGIATVGGWTLGGTSADAANGTMANTLSASASGAGSTSFSASAIYILSSDVQPIYNASCALSGCHVSGGSAPNLSTGFSRGSTVGVVATCNSGFFRVQAGNATNSVLYRRIFDAGICVGFMPPGTSGLSAGQQKIIRAWINNGALNN